MGLAAKITATILRVMEFISAVIVAALLGRYLYMLDLANVGAGSRVIYAEVIAGLSIFFSLVLFPPVRYSYYAFPLDLVMFICWMVAFGLLDNLVGGRTCSSYWYWNSWGYYWGGFWRTVPRGAITAATVGSVGCGSWRSTLAFSFIGGFCWLGNALTGFYLTLKHREQRVARAANGNIEGNIAGDPGRRGRGWLGKEKPTAAAAPS